MLLSRKNLCWYLVHQSSHRNMFVIWESFLTGFIQDGSCQQTPEHVLLPHTTVAIGPPFTWHRFNSRPCSSANSQSPWLLQRSACSPIHWEIQAVAVSSEGCCSSHLSDAGTCERDRSYTKQAALAQFPGKSQGPSIKYVTLQRRGGDLRKCDTLWQGGGGGG